MMQYKEVGRTGIRLSAVGFGTCQLRMIPERQAKETLKRGFELGVNWVHTAPDYDGADRLVAEAVAESGRDVMVLNQAMGAPSEFEALFEQTCRLLGKDRLELFGINCIDDCEFLGQNVWGEGGMVEILARKKREGRLGAAFCSTHGPPDYVERLIVSGCFDAVMLSYNPLGFHVLSYFAASEGKRYEDLPANRERIFPLAREHEVGLLVMKPLAGGLLCPGKAFPPFDAIHSDSAALSASDVLRSILLDPAVTAVVAGTLSVSEAEENALAGHKPIELALERLERIEERIARMRAVLCDRCGECEPTCSRSLPISWLFRDAYLWNFRSESFMSQDRLAYFHLHPEDTLACLTCTDRTCRCPRGIEIPSSLARMHARMLMLREKGLLPAVEGRKEARVFRGYLSVQVLSLEAPARLQAEAKGLCRLWLHNCGDRAWRAPSEDNGSEAVVLGLFLDDKPWMEVPLRQDVPPGESTHLTFEVIAPPRAGSHLLRLSLKPAGKALRRGRETPFHAAALVVEEGPAPKNSHAGASADLRASAKRAFARTAAGLKEELAAGKRKAVRGLKKVKCRILPSAVRPQASASHPDFGVRYVEHNLPDRMPAAAIVAARVTLENTGRMTWYAHPPEGNSVDLVVRFGEKVAATHKLPLSEVKPSGKVTVHFPLPAPGEPGRVRLFIELVQQKVAIFTDRGVPPLEKELIVGPRDGDPNTEAFDEALKINPWFYQPTRGIGRSADGRTYPLFAARAKGCRLWDLNGREYIDYVMGWGSVLLGYADERIKQALAEALETGSVTPFPHPYEMEVSRMLVEDIPSAEMVVFGKNGSDACTVAARMARVLTGRKTILYCGYHGWQDFWAEQHGFAITGIPERPERLVHRFKFNDAGDFFEVLEPHRGDLAAVMIEPAGPWGGEFVGPEPDADAGFLKTIARAARKAGALLIFDEIVTGYRYPQNSVQKAKGVTPDLTCLGKALASGMPLSAVVGKADAFREGLPRCSFGPTFKGEVYSFAAARAAIPIYRREPVADHIWSFGMKLKEGVNALCRAAGLAAEMKGPPFRMAVIFDEKNQDRFQMKRTLLQQEMLKEGILSYNGVMLPSYAHDDAVLERTLSAMRCALEKVAAAEREDAFDRYLELPHVLF